MKFVKVLVLSLVAALVLAVSISASTSTTWTWSGSQWTSGAQTQRLLKASDYNAGDTAHVVGTVGGNAVDWSFAWTPTPPRWVGSGGAPTVSAFGGTAYSAGTTAEIVEN